MNRSKGKNFELKQKLLPSLFTAEPSENDQPNKVDEEIIDSYGTVNFKKDFKTFSRVFISAPCIHL